MSEDLKDDDPNNNTSKDSDPNNNTILKSEVLCDESVENRNPNDNVPEEESYANFPVTSEAAVALDRVNRMNDEPSDRNGGSQLPCRERIRSQSLNLPSSYDPEIAISVGRTLRRLSSEFEQNRRRQFQEQQIQRRSSFTDFFSGKFS